MTDQHWKRVREVLGSALELEPSARSQFVQQACAGEDGVAGEVQVLLEAHDRAGEFLRTAPPSTPPPSLERNRLGPYELVGLVGSGGMGEVYRARDTRLGRQVALKVLSGRFARDRQALERFRREACAVAALSHPNVLAIHDIGQDDGIAYAVMELLEGQTLRQRLDDGEMGVKEAIGIAVQVARGLAAAHEKGIVHRDIKPENVFLTREGVVKILDFGIAKMAGGNGWVSTTAPTTQNAILGTAGYMSPEQVLGGAVDQRSDVFSFGAVLYEMLCGRRAFSGPDAQRVMLAVLTGDPPPLASGADAVFHRLDAIVGRCLARRPEDRYPSMREVTEALRRLPRERRTSTARRDARRRRWAGIVRWPVGVLSAGALATFLWDRPEVARFEPRPSTLVPLTTFAGREYHPSFSADGNYVAFIWDGGPGGTFDLYNKLVGSETALRLTRDPARECCPAWSPDGRYVAFIRASADREHHEVMVVPAVGGAQRLLKEVHGWFGSSLSWSPDGRHLLYSDALDGKRPFRALLLALDTLDARVVTEPPRGALGDAFPTFSPDGTTIAFARYWDEGGLLLKADLVVAPAVGGTAHVVHHEPSEVGGLDWTPDGLELVFSSMRVAGARLWRVPVGGGTPRVATQNDDPPMANAIGAEAVTTITDPFRVSVARHGNRLVHARSSSDTDIWRVAMGGGTLSAKKLIASTRSEEAPQFSPDGERIAFSSERGSPNPEIWVCGSEGSQCFQLTNLRRPCGTPRWSPDGRRIAFDAVTEGKGSDIYAVDVETRAVQQLTDVPADDSVPSWSIDGRWIYFASDRDGMRQVWKMAATGGAPRKVTRGGGLAAFEAPDGRSLYYTLVSSPGVWQVPVEGGEERRVLDGPRCWGYWALGPNGIFTVGPHGRGGPVLTFHPFASGRPEILGTLPGEPACGETGLALSPAGGWLAYVAQNRDSDIVMIEDFR